MRLIDTAWGVSVLVKLPSCLVRQNRAGFAAVAGFAADWLA